ncbi:hypothetical protein RclHR1_19720002 [Rhizophagus clarus]|uniref:HAT C-terminal dimerisation domain-containing protein n=1 Tax=Rhizophagus clarus TaxID=94130 RepID=A0A2Z6RID2_9GLOM|nr:hypothetical protein RclHR1_19720002 [Rhizophagus clarus]
MDLIAPIDLETQRSGREKYAAFRIIEHSFFIVLLKELNADYDPPTCEYLSNRLLEIELCNVNKKMDEDIKNQRNLTFNGWTFRCHQSIWNFIILTLSRKEYLYQLSDLSLDSHTAEYLAMQIEEIIKNGGLKSYCVTRWATSSELVNSVLNLKLILKKMINKHENLLTNYYIKLIIQRHNFFSDLEILAFVLNPLRKAILSLKSRSATLADCYLNLAKLGAVLKNLPRSFHCNFQLINWWNLIETKPEPESLPIVALYLFSICPNSAFCEKGFSNLGWLTNKRHLQLEVETLESMCKIITYWKSNARKEFGFFGQEMKNKPKLNEIELNKRVTEALAETDNTNEEEDNEFEDNSSQPVRRIINGEIIPHNNVVVLIESVWIENEIDLSNNLILKDIGNIPKDLNDDFIDNEKNNNEDIVLMDDETIDDTNGKGILNYNVDDLFNEYVNEN